jgi:hypothetical protein
MLSCDRFQPACGQLEELEGVKPATTCGTDLTGFFIIRQRVCATPKETVIDCATKRCQPRLRQIAQASQNTLILVIDIHHGFVGLRRNRALDAEMESQRVVISVVVVAPFLLKVCGGMVC